MFQNLLSAIATFIARRPGLVVSLVAIAVILSAISAQNIQLTTGTESMFSKENIVYRQYKLYQKDFGVGTDRIFVLVKGDDVVSRDVYTYMLDLQCRMENIESVGATVSAASIIVGMFGELPTDEALLRSVTELYAKNLVPKQTLALIFVQLTTTDKAKQEEVAKEIEKMIRSSNPPVGVKVELTGGPALGYQIKQEIRKSFRVTMAASTILMVLILFLTFSGAVRKNTRPSCPL